MNYERALKELLHGRTNKPMLKKKLCNATWLHRVFQQDSGAHLVSLSLFDKHILTWKPDGNIALNSYGHHRTTKDRYNNYLPSGFHVWQERPYWYIHTPTGVRPFFDEMELRADGSVVSFPTALNNSDARTLKADVYEYSKLYAARLVNGLIAREPSTIDCHMCRTLEMNALGPTDEQKVHLHEHVYQETTPAGLAMAAVNRLQTFHRCFAGAEGARALTRGHLRDVIEASWFESQKAWRKPTTKKKLIEQTELLMTAEKLPRLDLRPRYYIKNLRMLIEDYLLDAFGFERMED